MRAATSGVAYYTWLVIKPFPSMSRRRPAAAQVAEGRSPVRWTECRAVLLWLGWFPRAAAEPFATRLIQLSGAAENPPASVSRRALCY